MTNGDIYVIDKGDTVYHDNGDGTVTGVYFGTGKYEPTFNFRLNNGHGIFTDGRTLVFSATVPEREPKVGDVLDTFKALDKLAKTHDFAVRDDDGDLVGSYQPNDIELPATIVWLEKR